MRLPLKSYDRSGTETSKATGQLYIRWIHIFRVGGLYAIVKDIVPFVAVAVILSLFDWLSGCTIVTLLILLPFGTVSLAHIPFGPLTVSEIPYIYLIVKHSNRKLALVLIRGRTTTTR